MLLTQGTNVLLQLENPGLDMQLWSERLLPVCHRSAPDTNRFGEQTHD